MLSKEPIICTIFNYDLHTIHSAVIYIILVSYFDITKATRCHFIYTWNATAKLIKGTTVGSCCYFKMAILRIVINKGYY